MRTRLGLARVMATATVVALAASACGGEASEGPAETGQDGGQANAGNDDADETTDDSAAGEADTSVTGEITFMTWASYADDELIPAFQEKYPNVDVTIEYVPAGDSYSQRLQSLAVSNDLPDVIGASPQVPSLVEEGLLLDLSQYLEEPAFDQEQAWAETFEPVLLERVDERIPDELQPNEEVWGVPFGAITTAVVYNTEIFDELGLQPPADWAEFTSNNEALKEAGYTPMSLTGEVWDNWWIQLMWDQTARDISQEELFSGEVPFTDSRLVEGVAIVQDMYQNGTFPEGGVNHGIEESQALFVRGEMAQFLTVPENFVQYLVENTPFEVDAYPLPGVKGVEPVRTLGGDTFMLGVSADSENKEAAVAFTKFLTSNTAYDVMADHYVVSPTHNWEPPEETGEIMEAFNEAAAGGYVSVMPHNGVGLDPELRAQIADDLMPAVFTGELTPEQYMAEVRDVYAQEHPDVN